MLYLQAASVQCSMIFEPDTFYTSSRRGSPEGDLVADGGSGLGEVMILLRCGCSAFKRSGTKVFRLERTAFTSRLKR